MRTSTDRGRRVLAPLALLLFAAFLLAAPATSAAAPQWSLSMSAFPDGFIAGAEGNQLDGPAYRLRASNVGTDPTTGVYSIADTFPSRLTPSDEISAEDDQGNPLDCEIQANAVTCNGTTPIEPGGFAEAIVPVDVSATANGRSVLNEASVEGGGAPTAFASLQTQVGLPVWRLTITSQPTNFGSEEASEAGYPLYDIVATNIGDVPSAGPITISQTAPAGIVLTPVKGGSCGPPGQTVTCVSEEAVAPGENLLMEVRAGVGSFPEGTTLASQAEISGGGALPTSAETITTISSSPLPFGFLAGLNGASAVLNEPDGSPASQAGSHPYQLTVDLGFPSRRLPGGLGEGGVTGVSGGLRDLTTDLPRGLIVDPAASPVLCTEDELESHKCPDASSVGVVAVLTTGGGTPQPSQSPLFNMVPPAGVPAALGFDAAALGIFVHLKGEVRSDGDFGLSATTNDILSRGFNPVLAAQAELWGDPSDPSHDRMRGACGESLGPSDCPVPPAKRAFLTLPGECSDSLSIGARADSWEEPTNVKTGKGPITDASGNPSGVDGCNQVEFEPTIEAQPTTNLADSPSGLDFRLRQPQDFDLGHLSTAALRDATVTLPEGMVVNPAQADGLEACDADQIGLQSEVGQRPVRFDKQPDNCPDAAKIGTVEVQSPLLVRYDDANKPEEDAEGNPIPEVLSGSLFIAEPFENPFGSLLAIYLSINDPKSGTVAKLAGEVIPDPITGRISTRFEENPQLPLEEVELHLFEGSRAPLITPISCGAHTTTSTLTPWSSPEGADAHPSASFQTSAAPEGGACPQSEDSAAHSPSFSAGTLAPSAGAFSPFVLKLARQDGTRRLAGIDVLLPPGLAARFAGVGICSEAQIAQAKGREKPNMGALEQQSPSCPASSRVGEVRVSAGAGPTPFQTKGEAYLSGPYKGAPLSMAIITPAVAGPFDLGAVVVRTALYVDPESARGHAVSDPLPRIIAGIPLDVRKVEVRLDRADFTLNPTSCDPMQITGAAASFSGGPASLSNPFQVGGCPQLPFKPKLSLKLKGGTKRASNPKLIATLKAKPGEANIASAQVKLPRSAFLDQAHIRTICTRVQFAADACPKGSIYGKASAITPLLDYPLSGNVYLRSSNHKLPDLVVSLRGPDYQPIHIDLVGRTDSVKGALRNSFEAVPDAPVSSFRLELFGGKRGLVVNSRDLCARTYRAAVHMEGQNGKVFDSTPVVGSGCGKQGNRKGPRRGSG
jgi:hypothetical protein